MVRLLKTALAELKPTGEASLKVIRYFRRNPSALGELTQTEIARRAGVSQPAVSRCIDQLGYASRPAFLTAVAQHMNTRSDDDQRPGRADLDAVVKRIAISPDVHILAEKHMQGHLNILFTETFPQPRFPEPLRVQFINRLTSEKGRTSVLPNPEDAVIILASDDLPSCYRFSEVFQKVRDEDCALIVVQAFPFEIPDAPANTQIVCLHLASDSHAAVVQTQLLAFMAEVWARAHRIAYPSI